MFTGSLLTLTFLAVIDLVVASQLSIVGQPRNVRLSRGDRLDLSCEAFGTPVPTIQWFKDGKAMPVDTVSVETSHRQKYEPTLLQSPVMTEKIRNFGLRTFQMSTTSSKVQLPCTNRDAAGVYTCVAGNGVETVDASATVDMAKESNVLFSGNGCSRKRAAEKVNAVPAEIYMWTDSRMERPGVSVQLMCRAKGNPAPKMVWYEIVDADDDLSSRVITPDDTRYAVLSNGDLLIKKTPPHVPVSMFKCTAINQHGQDSVTSMLLEILDDTSNEWKENVADWDTAL